MHSTGKFERLVCTEQDNYTYSISIYSSTAMVSLKLVSFERDSKRKYSVCLTTPKRVNPFSSRDIYSETTLSHLIPVHAAHRHSKLDTFFETKSNVQVFSVGGCWFWFFNIIIAISLVRANERNYNFCGQWLMVRDQRKKPNNSTTVYSFL